MNDILHAFMVLTLIIGLIGLFDVFVLPGIKANASVTEAVTFPVRHAQTSGNTH